MPEPKVIIDLFDDMERSVTDYGPGAIRIDKRIDGTAFFPGGTGLWRALSPHGPNPPDFPSAPLMVLGHNFDKVAAFSASCRRGIELMEAGTWLILRRYLQAAVIKPEKYFFYEHLRGFTTGQLDRGNGLIGSLQKAMPCLPALPD